MFVLFPVFPPSLLCLPVSVCVWQGAWLLLSCSRSDTPVLNSFQSPLSLKAWSPLHSDAGLLLLHACVWCFPTRLFMLIASRIYQPANTLPFQPVFCLSCSPCRSSRYSASHCSPCRSSRYSASPDHPAVPAGICLPCSPCRFQPESTSPDLINFVKYLSSLVSCLLWGPNLKLTITE